MDFYKKLRGIYSKLSVFDLVLLMFIFVLVFYSGLVLFLGTTNFFVTVVSGSMEPVFFRGDLIIISKTLDYKKGEIIAFQKNNDILIHRIAGETKGGFKTKGDKNNRLDFGVVRKEDIFGKSIIVIPKVGHINLFLAGK